LKNVKAPTLMIVGSADDVVLELNNQAQRHLQCDNEILIISGASHLFEEVGALDRVAESAANWFHRYLKANS
jgi:putative phosphoribosyl transferase